MTWPCQTEWFSGGGGECQLNISYVIALRRGTHCPTTYALARISGTYKPKLIRVSNRWRHRPPGRGSLGHWESHLYVGTLTLFQQFERQRVRRVLQTLLLLVQRLQVLGPALLDPATLLHRCVSQSLMHRHVAVSANSVFVINNSSSLVIHNPFRKNAKYLQP